ncbi:hypothetical protein TVD_08140 [Thioalkalivibrio versutus]|uniref:Uncharacterized protein n=1 Tax=Thioalkalivibrio versutus TaxID=106634 RepID=A0A0G3G925_9GAMM|nr:hypothetical protein [Thioalkalivibrio versutus]AKJ95331.1 hypothetical protein TVD_08140 [Thioalkalivibrio versutus]
MNELEVPESLQRYHGSRIHRSAIDLVIVKKGMAEAEFDWDSLDLFYQSYLSAEITRYDNWKFLLEANRLIWGKELPDFGGSLKECSTTYYERENSAQYAWEEQSLYRSLVRPDEISVGPEEALIGCWLDGPFLRLFMWLRETGDSYSSNDWSLGDKWEVKHYDSERRTARGLKKEYVNLSKAKRLDLVDLKAAADDAIALIKENIRRAG